MKGICNKIILFPGNIELEAEINIEWDFINNLINISKGYSLERDFLEKYPLLTKFIDTYSLMFLERGHLPTKEFEKILKEYD